MTVITRGRMAALAILGAAAGMGAFVASPAEATRTEARSGADTVAAQRTLPPATAASPEQRAAWLRSRATSRRRNHYPRPGWSVRQGQRAALKRRNQQRNRRAQRC